MLVFSQDVQYVYITLMLLIVYTVTELYHLLLLFLILRVTNTISVFVGSDYILLTIIKTI